MIKMHRLILGLTDPNIQGEHADRNGLNNQRYNLREANNSTNHMNVNPRGTSKYLGVSVHLHKVYISRIVIDRRQKYLGSFPLTNEGEIEAAKKYDEYAKVHHGNFANLNFK